MSNIVLINSHQETASFILQRKEFPLVLCLLSQKHKAMHIGLFVVRSLCLFTITQFFTLA